MRVDATVGVRVPTWAAAPAGTIDRDLALRPVAGTINLVAFVPVPMTPGALVNLVATATEAKTQALLDAGVPGTGTATDAVVVVCPAGSTADEQPFGGPRSPYGSALARAVHATVLAGTADSLERIAPGSPSSTSGDREPTLRRPRPRPGPRHRAPGTDPTRPPYPTTEASAAVIVLVLGGARSGKSAIAERRLLARPGPLTYVATGQSAHPRRATRRRHVRADRRPPGRPRSPLPDGGGRHRPGIGPAADPRSSPPWSTRWEPGWPPMRSSSAAGSSNGSTISSTCCRSGPTTAAVMVIVSDEVGMGVHPESEVGRQFRDVLGDLNQRVAALADEVVLIVAGRVLRLETFESWGES